MKAVVNISWLCGYGIAANSRLCLECHDGCYGTIVPLLRIAAMPLFLKATSFAGGSLLQCLAMRLSTGTKIAVLYYTHYHDTPLYGDVS